MKFLRPLLIGTGILAALLAVIFVLALQSSVQTWAANRVIANDPSLGITRLGRLSAGFNCIEISDVTIARPGLTLTLPSATLELPLFAALRNDIALHRLVARGWTLDLTAANPAPAASAVPAAETKSAGFEGVFKLLELPVDLSVDSADLAGVIIFPTEGGKPPGKSTVTISGGQLGAGREGRFTLRADATLADGVAPVTQLVTSSTLLLRMDTPRTFSRVAATNEAHAIGPGLPEGARLLSASIASREGESETYEVSVKSIAAGGEKTLVELHASNPADRKAITGTWKCDVNDTELTPFTLGRVLPAFTLGASGSFRADPHFQEIQLSGKTDLIADRLDAVYAGLSALGRIQVRGDFDLVHRSAGVRVNRLMLDVAGKSPVASVNVLQAMEIVPATGEIKVASPDADLVRISLTGVPLAWGRPFTPPDLEVSGDDLRGELVARADQGGFAVRSVSPLQIGNLSVTQAGRPIARALDFSLTVTGSHGPAGWQADVSEIAARSGGVDLFSLAAKAGQSAGTDQPIKVTGHLLANLPALLSQPAAAEFQVVDQGKAEMDFTASVSSVLQQLSSKLTLSDLRAGKNLTLPSVTGDLRADRHADGRIEASVPLVFDLAGRTSDIELSATLMSAGKNLAVDAQVLSRELYLEDLKTFAALSPPAKPSVSPPKGAPAPAPTTPAPEPKPVWAGVTGQVKIALKKVVFAAAQPPVEISTSVKITPDVLTLESLKAAFPDGAAAKADGVIKFQAAAPAPYDVNASISATGFDPEPFLAAANPGKPPTVEGKFDFNGKVTGRAASLDKLADTANVDAQLVSRGGRFHGFATSATAANLGKMQEGASKVGSLLSIAGSVLGKSELARPGEKARAGSDTIKRLVDFNFDQLNIDIAHRAGAATTEIKNFSILSPDMRLLGLGWIDSKSGLKSILQSAMNLDLQMAVRGAQADDLRILDLLKKEADQLGYTALLERFSVKGTPSQPDALSLIQQIVAKIR